MKAKDLRKKTERELAKLAADAKAKLQQLRFDLPSGKVKNVREIRKLRREIARIATMGKKKQQ
ncbi:MAG TPA: 50S ribosomal protein L29 [Candidatus Paceibacterota bacterium]